MIAGLTPGGTYQVIRAGSTFTISAGAGGAETASAAGVLTFVR